MIRIGTAEYKEGPTGVTVFRFGRKVLAAYDVRGEPITANTEYMRLGRDVPLYDAVVLSGGSAYGLESTTAVATAMKDDHVRAGTLGDVGLVTGAIIYDLGDRRLNEVYPDKRLAQAAFRAAKESVFRVGSAGAGRMAETGWFFGLNAHSGQGGAYYEKGTTRIACFTVNNAAGVVTDRKGQIRAGYPDPTWPAMPDTAALLGMLRGAGVGGARADLPKIRRSASWWSIRSFPSATCSDWRSRCIPPCPGGCSPMPPSGTATCCLPCRPARSTCRRMKRSGPERLPGSRPWSPR